MSKSTLSPCPLCPRLLRNPHVMIAFIPRGRLHRALAVKIVTRLALRLLVMPSPVLEACRRLTASCTETLCRIHLMCRFPSAIGLQVKIAPEISDGLLTVELDLHRPWLLHETAATLICKRESPKKMYSVWRGMEGRAKLRLHCCEGSQSTQGMNSAIRC